MRRYMETNIQLLINHLEKEFLVNCKNEGQLLRGKIILDIVLRQQMPKSIDYNAVISTINDSDNALIETLITLYITQTTKGNSFAFNEINEKVFEIVITRIKDGRLGFENGSGALFNYFACLLENNLNSEYYVEKILEVLDNVLDEEYNGYMNIEFHKNIMHINNDFSLESGKTGLLLILLDLFNSNKLNKRIESIVSRLKTFVEHQIDYLVQHILPVGSILENYSFFPIEYVDNISTVKNSLGWSNGDLGHILMLEKASLIFQRNDFDNNFMDRMGSFTLSRKNNLTTEIEHSDFESGSSGVAMMYRQLHRQTQNDNYLLGYEFWKNETLKLLENDILTDYYENNFDFLGGSLGVILTLNAFENSENSLWTDILMIK
jgi:Lanthionine synthetase C-like protein